MTYIKYKEITKFFDFSLFVSKHDLPAYVLDYIYEDEHVLAAYKTSRDYGVFTEKKMILFDNAISINPYKEIFTISYKKLTTCSILFRPSKAELKFDLESGFPLRVKFTNMSRIDKVRLRLLYSFITRVVCNQDIPESLSEKLINDNILDKDE